MCYQCKYISNTCNCDCVTVYNIVELKFGKKICKNKSSQMIHYFRASCTFFFSCANVLFLLKIISKQQEKIHMPTNSKNNRNNITLITNKYDDIKTNTCKTYFNDNV